MNGDDPRGGIPEGATVVGMWRRRTDTSYDTLRLIRAGGRWFVRRRIGGNVENAEHPNRSLAYRAISKVVADAWVYFPPPQRRPLRHAGRRDTVAG